MQFLFAIETSNDVIQFLKKNGFITLMQESELKQSAKEQKMNELDALLKFFPENEEQVAKILQKIHKLTQEDYYPKEGDEIFQLPGFLYVKRKFDDAVLLTYDPQTVEDYFNYLLPQTIILTRSAFTELSSKTYPKPDSSDIQILSVHADGVRITSAEELVKKQETEEEVSEDAVKQLDKIIKQSVQMNASDVHIEVDTDETGTVYYKVRLRIDGVLQETLQSKKMDVFSGILSQVKLKSGLRLDETRLPQDGRLNYSIFGTMYSFRVSTKPVIVIDMKQGGEMQIEKIVIRKMPDIGNLTLAKLGNTEYAIKQLQEASDLAHGFNVVTGPTGSGKTTLLYALIRNIDTARKNVSTIEDPVEAELRNVNQTQVQPEIGLNFSRVLRAELRQDPDIIMVGEMRDKETAEIAAEASLTGHLVFSTLHTKNAVSSVTRLINMGLPSFIVGSALSYCIAQRLIRKLCPHCKKEVVDLGAFKKDYVQAVLQKIKSKEARDYFEKEVTTMKPYTAQKDGCDRCFHTGYAGRTAILEVFKITEKAEQIILKQEANEMLLQEEAEETGMMTMEADGMIKVMRGGVSVEELYTVLVAD